jgi:hypothetical protein
MKFLWCVTLPILAGVALAQAPVPTATPRTQIAGTVTEIDVAGKQISVKTDKGEAITVPVADKVIIHIPLGETDVRKGTKMEVANLAVGDRVVATARSVFVRTKADIAQAQQKDLEDWHKRGTTGTVEAIDTAARNFTIKVGQRTFTVQPSDKTEYHRYSLDSAKFSDAKDSNFAEVKIGDQAKVLGNRSADGATIQAEKVYSGSFRQIAGTIKTTNPQSGELVITDLATKKPLTIKVDSESTMRKLPAMMATMLARRYGAGRGQGSAQAPDAGGPSGQAAGAGGRDGMFRPGGQGGPPGQGGPGGRGGRNGDIGQMLDQLPAMPLAELKPGDAIMVSTTQGSDPTHVTAITLLAGVEPLLTASPTATRDIMGGWNLGGGGGEGNQ